MMDNEMDNETAQFASSEETTEDIYAKRVAEARAWLEEKRKAMLPIWEEEERQEEALRKEMAIWSKRYTEAGLGDRMMENALAGWPAEARNYPGGPVAVYQEAIRSHRTWEEVCGYSYKELRHSWCEIIIG